MARGNLYFVEMVGNVNLTWSQKLKEKYQVDSLPDFLNDERDKLRLGQSEPDEYYNKIKGYLVDNYSGRYTDPYSLPAFMYNEMDYANNIPTEEWQQDLFRRLIPYVDVFFIGDFTFFYFTKEAKQKWFLRKYENFHEKMGKVTLEQFSSSDFLWRVREAISDDFGDAFFDELYCEFHPFDEMVRIFEPGKWYIVKNAFLMH